MAPLRIALLATDNREHHRRYDLPSPYFGPAVEAILQGLAGKADVEIHVISCAQQSMPAPEKLSSNTRFHLLHVPKLGWLRTGYQGCIRAVRHKLRDLRPDIVHGQGTERDCAISAAFSGFPNVITIHGNIERIAMATHAPVGSYLWCTSIVEKFTIPRAGGVLCNSAYTKSVVEARARQSWLVPNALRLPFFEQSRAPLPAPSKPVLLNVGVISSHKRQRELLEVAMQLHDEGHLFEMHFIGQADNRQPYVASFLHHLEKMQRAGFVRHFQIKSSSELIAAFDAASALIHTPSEEAFGLVVAEALARNLKLFATSVGGVLDIATGVEATELFPVSDKIGLRLAISRWLAAGSPKPVTAAAEMRRRYHPNVIADRHRQIYREFPTGGRENNPS